MQHILFQLEQFVELGGPVLWLIACSALFLWGLIFERVIFLHWVFPKQAQKEEQDWENRVSKQRQTFSHWNFEVTRLMLISRYTDEISHNMALIKTMIAICPLLGLLGTVTGMIDVFTILSLTGGSDAKSMAAGVSRATIPTMAGMVVALSGIFANIYLKRIADRESELFEERLPLERPQKERL
tara:strand:+ start:3276 stop:3827 length:552 start_codon:yes stop_codon:yes gene_type:complete